MKTFVEKKTEQTPVDKKVELVTKGDNALGYYAVVKHVALTSATKTSSKKKK